MEPIRFSILGCGQIAQRHAAHIAALGKLVSVCDVDANKAETLAALWNAKAFGTTEEMFAHAERPDVIVICTPNGLHAEHAIRCLHAGFHVLVEKPMALTSEDCEIMMQAAKLSGKRLFTVVQNRFNKPVQAVRAALDNGAFGDLYSMQLTCFWNRPAAYYDHPWHGKKDMDGGVLFTQFSHFIDLLCWFFGDVRRVQSVTRNAAHEDSMEFEDSGIALLEFKSGLIGTLNFSVNSFGRNREGSLTLLGSKGTAKIGGEYLNKLEYAQFESYELEVLNDDTPPNHYGAYEGSMSNHRAVYENIIAALQRDEPLYASAYEAMLTVELIEKIYAAAEG